MRLPLRLRLNCDQGAKSSKSLPERVADFAYSSIGLYGPADVRHHVLAAAGGLLQTGEGRVHLLLITALFEAGQSLLLGKLVGRIDFQNGHRLVLSVNKAIDAYDHRLLLLNITMILVGGL